MPQKDLTEIICVIDRSGSMGSIRSDAIGGFNMFLEEQKKVPLPARMTLALFNENYEILHDGIKLSDVQPLTNATYQPAGVTALLDAIGRTIDAVGTRLSTTPEEQRPEKVLFVILTDGLENASKDYRKSRIAEMIKHQQEHYSWRFEFLGANVDAFAEANALNIPHSINFAADSEGIGNVYCGLTRSTTGYRTGQ